MDRMAFADEFCAEANEHLRLFDALLLTLERDPRDPSPVRQMFLSAHTIKGGAAMVGYPTVRRLAHAMEDVLARLRDERQPLDEQTADLLFSAVDLLRELLAASPNPAPAQEAAASDVIERLRSHAGVAPTSQPHAMPQFPPALGRPRVLVVESSPTIRLLQATLLTDGGFDVEAVGDGVEALSLVQSNRYDLIVIAAETRGLRGLELAATLSAMPSHVNVPVVLTSTDHRPELQQQAAEAGVRALIRKGSYRDKQLVQTARELVMRAAS